MAHSCRLLYTSRLGATACFPAAGHHGGSERIPSDFHIQHFQYTHESAFSFGLSARRSHLDGNPGTRFRFFFFSFFRWHSFSSHIIFTHLEHDASAIKGRCARNADPPFRAMSWISAASRAVLAATHRTGTTMTREECHREDLGLLFFHLWDYGTGSQNLGNGLGKDSTGAPAYRLGIFCLLVFLLAPFDVLYISFYCLLFFFLFG